MKIVITDGKTLNPGDLEWAPLEHFGRVSVYDNTQPDQLIERCHDADILLTNKVVINAGSMVQMESLKLIVVTATGVNNVDLKAAARQQVTVCNVPGYGTEAVAQHTFALLFALTNRVAHHSRAVHHGKWTHLNNWTFWNYPLTTLGGKTMGIIGMGSIGKKVAEIAQALGMHVVGYHPDPNYQKAAGIEVLPLDELLTQSDVVSLHAPLTGTNYHLIDAKKLSIMKPNAILLNTARGQLIDETALASALRNYHIGGAGLDVLENEPPAIDNPLMGLDNCIITPHNAWASIESRHRLMQIAIDNVSNFIAGTPTHVVTAS